MVLKTDALPATYREIMSQADTLQATATLLQGLEIPGALVANRWTPVFTGCGTSYYLALAAAGAYRALAGRRAAAIPGAEAWLLPDLSLDTEEAPLLVPISRSGTTTETVRAAQSASGAGVPVLAVTANGADLSAAATFAVELNHVSESSVVMTQSFSNLLLALHWLAAELSGTHDTRYLRAIQDVPAAVGSLLADFDSLGATLADGFDHYVFLGSGPHFGIAQEAMLKMKEMTQLPSESYHALEFRHGPMSTVTARSLVCIVSCPRTSEQDRAVAADVRRLGGTSLLLGPGSHGRAAGAIEVELPGGFPDWVYGNLAIPFLQLLAYHRTRSLGLNPDEPRNLSQVVRIPGA